MTAFTYDECLEVRPRQSLGSSSDPIHRMVADALSARGVVGGRLLDVGCGGGALWRLLGDRFASYCGIDAVRYEQFPPDAEFRQTNLDCASWPIADRSAEVVTAVEVIEHLENPWAFVRTLARLAAPGGWIVITTPNQRSLLSLATLIVKGRFSAFQDVHYPAHRTALIESDLRRIAHDAGIEVVDVLYSRHGRLPLSSWHYPERLSRLFPRALSDNLLIIGRKPVA